MATTLFGDIDAPPAPRLPQHLIHDLRQLGLDDDTIHGYSVKQAFAVARSLKQQRERDREARRQSRLATPAPVRPLPTVRDLPSGHAITRQAMAAEYREELAAETIDFQKLRAGLRGVAEYLTDSELLAVARLVADAFGKSLPASSGAAQPRKE